MVKAGEESAASVTGVCPNCGSSDFVAEIDFPRRTQVLGILLSTFVLVLFVTLGIVALFPPAQWRWVWYLGSAWLVLILGVVAAVMLSYIPQHLVCQSCLHTIYVPDKRKWLFRLFERIPHYSLGWSKCPRCGAKVEVKMSCGPSRLLEPLGFIFPMANVFATVIPGVVVGRPEGHSTAYLWPWMLGYFLVLALFTSVRLLWRVYSYKCAECGNRKSVRVFIPFRAEAFSRAPSHRIRELLGLE